MMDKDLTRPRVLRKVPEQYCARAPRMLRWAISPAARGPGVRTPDHSPSREETAFAERLQDHVSLTCETTSWRRRL